jgi:hypothetical protein
LNQIAFLVRNSFSKEIHRVYCPKCATPNVDGSKFCRACGTNLETVALALSDPSAVSKPGRKKAAKQKNWIEKRREGMKNIAQGTGLVTASALLGVPLGVFSHNPDWIIIWLVLVGWLTCWGVVVVVSGLGDLLESRFMRRQVDQKDDESSDPQLPATERPAGFADPVTAPNLTLPPSVTENTTNLLTKP